MGCDIHMYVEVKPLGSERWLELKRQTLLKDLRSDRLYSVPWADGRDYRAFSMLADVRNYDGIVPISPPRDLPSDLSIGVQLEAIEWADDGHSHSWLSLYELKELEPKGYWNKTHIARGVVHIKKFTEEWDKLIIARDGQNLMLSGPPSSWSRSIGGPPSNELFNISWQWRYGDCEHLIQKDLLPSIDGAISTFDFMDSMNGGEFGKIPFHSGIDEDCVTKRVRCVFWFDN